jgi:hypothetical protein
MFASGSADNRFLASNQSAIVASIVKLAPNDKRTRFGTAAADTTTRNVIVMRPIPVDGLAWYLVYLQLLDVVLSDAAKDLFLIATETQKRAASNGSRHNSQSRT